MDSPTASRKTTALLITLIVTFSGLLSGCIAVSAAKAGLSVGGAAAKTTVGVAGAAAGAAGSAANAAIGGGDDSPDQE